MRKRPGLLFSPWVLLALLVMFASSSVLLGVPWMSLEEAGAALGAADDCKINQLLYPTFGNPALVQKGETFVLEFDPRLGGTGAVPNADRFRVAISSSVDPFPFKADLPVLAGGLESSKAWPTLASFDLWRVTVLLPESVPEDLFDLTVTARVNGVTVTDSQPHALQALNEFKKDFTFCQLTDIHVFGGECSYPGGNYKERGNRHVDYRPGDDGYGARYYHKTINQINRIKPDFCVYTGDYMFGQDYFTKNHGEPWGTTTEYEYEQLWFYQETLALEVPVFLVPGNHDGYSEGPGEGANEDWLVNWQKIWGPLYYSFDYGDCHFVMCNSMDWETADRDLTDIFGIIMQPSHYKGQFRAGGDTFQGGYSQARFDAIDVNGFTDQLGWMRDDLAAHPDSALRVMAMHHEPWKDGGSGSMWQGDFLIGMGDGRGRLASVKLMKEHNVGLVLSGHDHSDFRGAVPWSDGTGQVLFVNTTSVSFQSDANSGVYPGYQRIVVRDGVVVSSNYQDPNWAYPSYSGVNVGGTTNLGGLSTPAVESSWSTPPGDSLDVTNTLSNHLARDFPAAYVEFPMPYLSGGHYYRVDNGTVAGFYDNRTSSPDHRTLQVRADLPAGQARAVRVYRSASPDRTAPTGTMKINNGARTTTSRGVTLSISAGDSGGSGLKQMMVSNRSDFKGAAWEDFRPARSWTLADGDLGARTVYVRLRDGSMPGNTATISGSIIYCYQVEPTGPGRTWYFAEGCTRAGFQEWLSIQNPNAATATVDITYLDAGGGSLRRSVKVEARSRSTVNVNDAVGPEKDVSARLVSDLPVLVERPMYFDYRGMWDGGHDLIGVTSPRPQWHFAEGSTRNTSDFNAHTWICLLNPQPVEVDAKITYLLESGDPVVKSFKLPARSRTTRCANWDVGPGHDLSMVVEAEDAIVCERPMYFTFRDAWDGGHVVMGSGAPANDWYLAEGTTHRGFETYLCIQNPNARSAEVTLTYMLDRGSVEPQKIKVPGMSRRTACVNDVVGPAKNVSTRVQSDLPVVAERPMYFNFNGAWDDGTCVMGATDTGLSWGFAEGCTRKGFVEMLSIQNPGNVDATVDIEYMIEGAASSKFQRVKVAKRSRQTVVVNDHVKGGYDLSAVVSSDQKIVVERPIYFNYDSRLTGGHCVVGRPY